MNMGGLQTYNDSVRSIKLYKRKDVTTQKWPCITNEDTPITFGEADTNGLDKPHNDSLVIELMLGDCKVTKVLVDTGSSVDLIFKETLRKRDIKDGKIKVNVRPLTVFDDETTMTIRMIKLPVYNGGVTKLFKFVIIDKPTMYNMTMGMPWILPRLGSSRSEVTRGWPELVSSEKEGYGLG